MLAAFFALLLSAGFSAHNANAQDLKVYRMHLDFYNPPKSVDDGLKEFANSTEGKIIIAAVATYFGADPKLVAAGLAMVPNYVKHGQDYNGEFQFEDGYQFCYGRRAGQVSAFGDASFESKGGPSTRPNTGGVGIYAHVPQSGVGGPGQGMEVVIEVVAVRHDVIGNYPCHRVPRPLFKCQGKSCVWGPGLSAM